MESDVAISKLFDKLKDKLDTEIILKTHAVWKIPQINENSTLGQQIKYYRRLANIKQADLAKELGYDRGVIDVIENRELKLVNVRLLKEIIKRLNIQDKIMINDDYISFLFNNPSKAIIDFRKKNNLNITDLAKMLNTEVSVIKKWESGKAQMTRTSYNKLKKYMNLSLDIKLSL